MTFNIRFGLAADGENSWAHRKDLVVEVVRRYRPHVIGIQEGLQFQLDYMAKKLEGYRYFGKGREGDLTGEYCAIFYDADRLKRTAHGQFWLSDTPEVPASKSFGNVLPRVATWGRFRLAGGGREFYLYNTHLDNRSRRSRILSAALILRRLKRCDPRLPLILLGDFNCTPKRQPYRLLTGKLRFEGLKGRFRDAYAELKGEGPGEGTFHGFRGHTWFGNVDYIFFRGSLVPRGVEVVRFHRGNRYPSDHYPVFAEFSLGEREKETEKKTGKQAEKGSTGDALDEGGEEPGPGGNGPDQDANATGKGQNAPGPGGNATKGGANATEE
jgi:endonuclease/exonuclease/phosphatase family metal-dependent hydrolase